MYYNEFESLGNDLTNIANAANGILSTPVGQAASSTVQTVINDATALSAAAKNIIHDIGPFAIGALLLVIGGLMLVFSFGEDAVENFERIASAIEKTVPVPVE
jgi:hypothetical protein